MGLLGVIVLIDLYHLIGEKNISIVEYLLHFSVRGIVLLGIPLLMNIGLFYVHFNLTTNPGIHDGFLSANEKAQMDVSETVFCVPSRWSCSSVAEHW